MSKGRAIVGVAFALLLTAPLLSAGTIWDDEIVSVRMVRAAISGVKEFISLVSWSSALPLRADGDGGGGDGGGGDGGGGDGGGGDGGGGDGGGGDGGSDDGGSSGDSTSTDSTSTDSTAAPDDPAANPSSDENADPNANVSPTDPTANNALTPEIDAIMSIPTTDPRGGTVTPPSPPTTTDDALDDVPVGAPGASGSGGVAPVDVGIHAVIVSGAMTPWDAIGKVPGVGTVTVTGGIVALGTTPIRGEPPGGGPQPSWLRLIPDLNLLNGSVIPPVVPNVIDVRITRYSFEAVEKPNN